MQEILMRIYCDVDDYVKALIDYCQSHLISSDEVKGLLPKSKLSLSEIMSIVIFFHLSNYRTFKHYYIQFVSKQLNGYFPNLLSYNRFVELMSCSTIPLLVYILKFRAGKCSGISFVDSTTIDVCDNHRIYIHKVFRDIAERGKSSTGWFYGFKLHLVINDCGEIISFCLTSGNVDDRDPSVIDRLSKELFGKLYADKGYISQKLFEKLFAKGVTLVTKLKKNMKNKLMDFNDRLMLRKRAIIESVNDFLKNICQIEHSRHRSTHNFLVNLIAGLVAYSYLPKKPSLHLYY